MKRLLLTVAALAPSIALADGDATKGEIVFKKCSACHNIDKTDNKIGPHLVGILGRKVAAIDGFPNYSDALKAAGAGGKVWDEASLAAWVTEPKKLYPGTRMVFTGLKKPEDVQDLIAYIKAQPAQ